MPTRVHDKKKRSDEENSTRRRDDLVAHFVDDAQRRTHEAASATGRALGATHLDFYQKILRAIDYDANVMNARRRVVFECIADDAPFQLV